MGTKHMPRAKALVGVQGDALIAMGQMLASEISAHSRATAVNGENQRAQNDMQVAKEHAVAILDRWYTFRRSCSHLRPTTARCPAGGVEIPTWLPAPN
jgi:hypothetical protein